MATVGKPLQQLAVEDQEKAAQIGEMARRIAEKFDPLQITLFGSFARGDQRPNSDVDLLVVLAAVNDKHRAAAAISRALADIPLANDVVVTSPSDIRSRGDLIGTILRPALTEGQVLFRRPGWTPELGVTPQERLDDARRWLQYAGDDLLFAEDAAKDPHRPPRYACLHAQQSAEKALKAVLIFEQVDFPRTHNVDHLAGLVPQTWERVKALPEMSTLSSWAVQARYPDALREATADEAATALAQARSVWDAVTGEFLLRGINS